MLFVDHRGGLRPRPPDTPAVPRNGIHALLWFDGQVLLVNPPGGNWLELPGGGIEPGEDPATALSRELAEEAGLDLPPERLVPQQQASLQSRYYAATRGKFWEYDQRFWLIELDEAPVAGEPLEPGHRLVWVGAPDLHEHTVHHVHRIGIDRLLGLHA